MKKILVGLMMVAMGLLIMTTVASAYPVSAGDYVKISLGLRDGSNSGGAFNISQGTGSTLFDTFCLEGNEFFTPGSSYYIGGITGGAIAGGYSGGNPDPISSQSAYLYSRWADASLTGAIAHTAANASALQLAIWKYEGEWTKDLTGTALNFYNAAATASGSYGVAVMNLYNSYSPTIGYTGNAQDMLVYSAVPEPGTMLLLGLGLIGLIGIRKINKRKQSTRSSWNHSFDALTKTERAMLIWKGLIPLRFSWER